MIRLTRGRPRCCGGAFLAVLCSGLAFAPVASAARDAVPPPSPTAAVPTAEATIVLEPLELPSKKEGGRFIRSAVGKDAAPALRAALVEGLRTAEVAVAEDAARPVRVRVLTVDQEVEDRTLFASQASWVRLSADVVVTWGDREEPWSATIAHRHEVAGRPYKADIQRAWRELFARIGRDVGYISRGFEAGSAR